MEVGDTELLPAWTPHWKLSSLCAASSFLPRPNIRYQELAKYAGAENSRGTSCGPSQLSAARRHLVKRSKHFAAIEIIGLCWQLAGRVPAHMSCLPFQVSLVLTPHQSHQAGKRKAEAEGKWGT
jgi:hypothetical protein